jgi:carbonic anhydrase
MTSQHLTLPLSPQTWRWLLTSLVLITSGVLSAHANDDPPKPKVIAQNTLRDKAEADKKAAEIPMKVTSEQLKETIEASKGQTKNVQFMMGNSGKKSAEGAHGDAPAPAMARRRPIAAAHSAPPMITELEESPNSRQYIRARAAAMAGHGANAEAAGHGGGDVHWAYEGEGGPQAWGKLKPEFNTCATGKRQSPINIEDGATLQGPAEPLMINYRPSNGTVVNNGHTIQVDVERGNTMTVRGSTYELLQFHFHQPAEERVNYRGFAMVAHLVHKNAEGQLAVIGVLIDPGAASSLINKVWTYMPLEAGDKVRMPLGMVDLNELLPKDMRYYQFMGSLTTPPCSEGVLWQVLKQPVTASREQIRLFSQMFPNNARPTQPANGRVIREAQ